MVAIVQPKSRAISGKVNMRVVWSKASKNHPRKEARVTCQKGRRLGREAVEEEDAAVMAPLRKRRSDDVEEGAHKERTSYGS
ncbi:hypothetical protein AA15669_0804 [Saccharibacter floricola DSM 15669]|uniref:Uncharacterized protein n=1 Tax=Saccharibacter floricola DSM 15669 TaxID=1123227 RepID=A0ABQ0NXY2_9PROT|nr:hypothetical protein AA15669_0804 [Saccharibacter floricola DSM 15669]